MQTKLWMFDMESVQEWFMWWLLPHAEDKMQGGDSWNINLWRPVFSWGLINYTKRVTGSKWISCPSCRQGHGLCSSSGILFLSSLNDNISGESLNSNARRQAKLKSYHETKCISSPRGTAELPPTLEEGSWKWKTNPGFTEVSSTQFLLHQFPQILLGAPIQWLHSAGSRALQVVGWLV